MKLSTAATSALLIGAFCGTLSRTASAQTDNGTCVASSPSYSDGVVSASAFGNMWATITGGVYFKVWLYADGVLLWTNAPGKSNFGVELPYMSDPGLVFDYTPAISDPLSSGTHTLEWVGSVTPEEVGYIDVGVFDLITYVTVP